MFLVAVISNIEHCFLCWLVLKINGVLSLAALKVNKNWRAECGKGQNMYIFRLNFKNMEHLVICFSRHSPRNSLLDRAIWPIGNALIWAKHLFSHSALGPLIPWESSEYCCLLLGANSLWDDPVSLYFTH